MTTHEMLLRRKEILDELKQIDKALDITHHDYENDYNPYSNYQDYDDDQHYNEYDTMGLLFKMYEGVDLLDHLTSHFDHNVYELYSVAYEDSDNDFGRHITALFASEKVKQAVYEAQYKLLEEGAWNRMIEQEESLIRANLLDLPF